MYSLTHTERCTTPCQAKPRQSQATPKPSMPTRMRHACVLPSCQPSETHTPGHASAFHATPFKEPVFKHPFRDRCVCATARDSHSSSYRRHNMVDPGVKFAPDAPSPWSHLTPTALPQESHPKAMRRYYHCD